MSGSVSKGKSDSNRSLQMMERPLMTPDELKSIPKGEFVVMKTGTHPMRTRLRLFLDWGISFREAYQTPDRGRRKVYYADRRELEQAIVSRCGTGDDRENKAEPPITGAKQASFHNRRVAGSGVEREAP